MKKNNKRTLLLVLLFIMIFQYIGIEVSATIKMNINGFKNITIDDGLSQSTVYSLCQDSEGYMWIGTGEGLNKYNGHEFEVYKSSKKDKETLSGNLIIDIKEDFNGDIWVGTATGLNRIDKKSNKIIRYISNIDGCNLSNNRIRNILIAKNGDIFVATDNGLNKYDRKNDNFIRIYDEDENGLSNQKVYTITEDIYGDYWVGTSNGLNKIDKKNNKVIHYFKNEQDSNTISGNYIYKLYADDKGYLWVGTYYGGLNRINISTGKIDRYMHSEEATSIPGLVITDILRDSRGNIWVSTEGGVAKFDEESETFKTWKYERGNKSSILSDEVKVLCEDRLGMIWIGSTLGISIFNPNNNFINYRNNVLDDNSLSDNHISGIYEDNDEMLWIGTVFTGVNILDRKNNTVIRLDYKKDYEGEIIISNNLIRDIVGYENNIWIATQHGLNKYNKNTNTIEMFGDEDGLVNNDVLSLCIDDLGQLWIGTVEGLCSYDEENGFKSYNNDLKSLGLNKLSIRDIYQDNDGEIWFVVANENKLVRYKNGKFSIYSLGDESYNIIMTISSNVENIIWIGTDCGLVKINKKTGKYDIFTEEDGLANNFIYGILFDEFGNPWISTNYGLSKFDLIKNEFINFNYTDGIQSNEFNEYSYYKSKSGEMFFGGIQGVTSFYPNDIKVTSNIPKVQIQSIESANNKLELSENIKLKYNENQIRFEFFMPDYSTPNKIQYSYKLEGLDKEEVNLGNKNYVSYTNLYPGEYTFKVKGRNGNGEWSEVTSIAIKVGTAPWKTPFAYLIYGLVTVILVYIVWNRVKILDNMVKQRSLELNKKLIENQELYKRLLKDEKYKNNYFINLSHELRTPLNLIVSTQQLIDKLNENNENIPKDKIRDYMKTIKRNSNRLLTLIDNIIYTSKIDAGNYKLNIKENDIVYLVEEISLSMKEYIESKGIELVIDPEVEEKLIECDGSDIERVILNLLSNAVKFTKEGGKIEIKIYDLNNKVKIVVKDNGIGIAKDRQKAIFNRFDQAYATTSEEYGGSGLGLTLSKQLIELHKGSIEVESNIGQGSEFTIVLPVNQ